MAHSELNPGAILGMSSAYWKSCALHAGASLDLFSVIKDSVVKGTEIARQVGADADGTVRLCNALVAAGLLKRREDGFANTEAGRVFLCSDSDRSVLHMIMHHHHLVGSWYRMDQAVRTGAPVPKDNRSSEDRRREAFLMGMFNNASQLAPRLVREFDLSDRKRLLDMGGGPGTYAVYFCLRNPGLSAVVYDLPSTRPFAEKTIARFGLSDRIVFQDGDYVHGAPEGEFDAAWLSHVLHGEGPEVCGEMVRKAADVLVPGGLFMVHEFILNDAGDGPEFPALFSLNMLVNTEHGRSYTEGEIKDMLSAAGLVNVRRASFRGPTDSGVIVGEKNS